MRRLNEVMDLKFSLLIFKQFHGARTRSQKKCLRTFVWQYKSTACNDSYSVRSQSCGAVYCNQSYLCICLFVGLLPR